MPNHTVPMNTLSWAAPLPRVRTKPQIRWTLERIQFLRDNYPNQILPELTKSFNRTFGVSVTEKSIGFQLTTRQIRKKPAEV